MLIQLHSHQHHDTTQGLPKHVNDLVVKTLNPYRDAITRVEVHLSDVTGHHHTELDTRCLMEARIAGHPPVAITVQDKTIHHALKTAAKKLRHAMDHLHSKAVRRSHKKGNTLVLA